MLIGKMLRCMFKSREVAILKMSSALSGAPSATIAKLADHLPI